MFRNRPLVTDRPWAVTLTAAALLALGSPLPALAASAGEVTHLSGAVVARKADGQSRILSVKSNVEEGDVLATAENSYARVKFGDGTEAVLRPSTQVKIDRFTFDEQKPQSDNMALSLLKGGLRAVTGLLGRRNPANMRVATPSATIGIRGTQFGVQQCTGDCANMPMHTALTCVDAVALFDAETPADIIRQIQPDILVKGADWAEDAIVGRDTVESRGGRVVRMPIAKGWSTSAILEKMKRIGH